MQFNLPAALRVAEEAHVAEILRAAGPDVSLRCYLLRASVTHGIIGNARQGYRGTKRCGPCETRYVRILACLANYTHFESI